MPGFDGPAEGGTIRGFFGIARGHGGLTSEEYGDGIHGREKWLRTRSAAGAATTRDRRFSRNPDAGSPVASREDADEQEDHTGSAGKLFFGTGWFVILCHETPGIKLAFLFPD